MDGFRNRLPTNVVKLAPVDPNAYRSGVAEGLQELGAAGSRAAAQDFATTERLKQLEYERQAQDETLSLSQELLALRGDYQTRLIEAKAAPPADINGFADTLTKDFETDWRAIAAKATTRDGQEGVERQAAAFQAGFRMSGQELEVVTRINRTVEGAQTVMNGYAAAARDIPGGEAGDAADRLNATAWSEYVQKLAVTAGADRAQQIGRQGRGTQIEQRMLGAVDRGDFDTAKRIADSDEAKLLWTPDTRDQNLRRIGAGERMAAAARKAEQVAATAETKRQIAVRKAELETGAGTPDDWGKLAAWQDSVGDGDGAVRSRAQATEMQAALGHRGDTLPELDQQIAALDAKAGSKGGLTAAEASRRSGLKTLRGQTAARLSDSGGALAQYAFATGKPLPALDPADPASMRARAAMAAVAAAQYGRSRIEPIQEAELPAFKDLMAGGPNERLRAADAIQGFASPRAIAGAAAQMAGADDGQFRIAALTPARELRRDILRGDETLAKNPSVFNDKQAQKDFAAWYGRSLSFVGGSYRNDIYQAARAFYAQRAVDGGETAYNPGKFAAAIETVLGRNPNGTGGVARSQGSLVLVPRGVRPDALLTTFARAGIDDYARAAGGRVPRWADGSAMTRGDMRGLVPTMLADGVYGFRAADGRLVNDDKGQAYTVDFAKLGGR